MKKRIVAFAVILAILAVCMPSVFATESQTPTIKNIIYMIPDGGGYGPYDFANIVKQSGGFDEELFPNKTPTNTDPMTLRDYLVGSVTTYSYDNAVTDSAAAGTALATGIKTNNGYVGVDHRGKPKANLVEAAQSVGKATGLVATYEWVHATPASFSAHAMDRNDYYNLYQQIENKNIDVVLGAGYGSVSSYATINNAIERGYTIIDEKADLENVKPGDRIWGDMANPSMPYDIDLEANQATLAEMTEAAITALSGDEDGFFLMVEGSKVDTGGHANDAVVTTSEYLAFDEAFKVAVDFAKKRTDTLVIAVPDHDTGGMILPASTNTAVAQVKVGTDPSTIFWTSTNHTAQNVGVWMYIPEGVNGLNGFNTTPGDTATTRSNYVLNNTDLAPYLANLMGVDLSELTKDLFVDVTSIGTYTSADRRFTFNNGNKYAVNNQSYYYKDGERIDLGYKQMVLLNGRVYVPADMIEEGDMDQVTEGYDGFFGEGTEQDPYLIADANDFLELTYNMVMGEDYYGQFFKQTANIDLSQNTDYTGIGAGNYFSGTYDGQGHTINVAMTTKGDQCIFPYVEGTIMNLGTTGTITSTGYESSAGIARSIRAGAKLVNCYSSMTINGYNVAGLVWSNYGTISNCYFSGSLSGSTLYAIAQPSDNYKFEACFYLSTCGTTQYTTGVQKISKTAAQRTLAATLNTGRAAAAEAAGVELRNILYWEQANSFPTMFAPVSTVTGVTVTPSSATVNKGEGLQLSAVVEGTYDPSQKVVWSIEPHSNFEGTYIGEDGFLTIDPKETMASFTVLAKSAQSGSISGICTITVGNEVSTEPDGSRGRPYLICNEQDFMAFTQNVIGGETYSGKFFKQTADLDMAGYPGYKGMGKPALFSGTYDGDGYVINLNIKSTKDECLFPYVDGVIMNLGTTGSVEGNEYTAGICRSLRAGGKMVNCWSSANLKGVSVAGVIWSNYGTIANCYFSGTRTATSGNHPIMETHDGYAASHNFYLGQSYVSSSEVTQITAQQLETNLATWLNEGIAEAAAIVGYPATALKTWTAVSGEGPRQRVEQEEPSELAAEFSSVSVGTTSITGTVDFDLVEDDYIAYVALFEVDSGAMLSADAVDVPDGTTEKPFTLTFDQLAEGEEYCIKLFLWDENLVPYILPVTRAIQ